MTTLVTLAQFWFLHPMNSRYVRSQLLPGPGILHGRYGVDWRTCYLSSAWFDISFKWRRVASRELRCWRTYRVIVSDADYHASPVGGRAGDVLLLSGRRRTGRRHMTAWRARWILLTVVSGYKWRSAATDRLVSLADAAGQSDRSRHRIQLIGVNRHAINKNGAKPVKAILIFSRTAYIYNTQSAAGLDGFLTLWS